MCLPCARSSTSEPQSAECTTAQVPVQEGLTAHLSECSLLPTRAGWAEQQRAAWPQFTPLLGHQLPVVGGQRCNDSGPVS